jgi:hypothetical protein
MCSIVRVPPFIHADECETMLHTRIHILRHVMQVCRNQDDLPRPCLCEPCLPTLQLTEGMQFTDKALATGSQHTHGLLEEHVQVSDVFENE